MGMKIQTAGNDVLSRSSLRGTKQSSALIIMELRNNVISSLRSNRRPKQEQRLLAGFALQEGGRRANPVKYNAL